MWTGIDYNLREEYMSKRAKLKNKYFRKAPYNFSPDNGPSAREGIKQHEGSKYLRRIYSAVEKGESIEIDVYSVLKAFNEPTGPIAHAIKKLLCAGQRGKGDRKADLIGVLAAVNRAIDQLEEDNGESTTPT